MIKMHKTVASKDGGYNVDLTPEEAAKIQVEWKKYAVEQAAEEAAAKIERKEAEKGFSKLTKDLPPAEAAALRKMLNM